MDVRMQSGCLVWFVRSARLYNAHTPDTQRSGTAEGPLRGGITGDIAQC